MWNDFFVWMHVLMEEMEKWRINFLVLAQRVTCPNHAFSDNQWWFSTLSIRSVLLPRFISQCECWMRNSMQNILSEFSSHFICHMPIDKKAKLLREIIHFLGILFLEFSNQRHFKFNECSFFLAPKWWKFRKHKYAKDEN